MTSRSVFKRKLSQLPPTPGVYLMKDRQEKVIYVGKAASLRPRVRSYFHSPRGMSSKTRALAEIVTDFEVIQTETEVEAFLLEDNLIKRYQPRFNIRLRDDKRYPYLKITDESFPRILIVRRRHPDGAYYFGPYTNAKAMRATLKLAQKIFPLRTCALNLPLKTPRRPCLNYHIGRCLAPCAEIISKEEYKQIIEGAIQLFEGHAAGLLKDLTHRMTDASKHQRYEQATQLRNQIRALSLSLERQSVVLPDLIDRDVIGIALEQANACAEVFLVRAGRLSGRETFHLHAPGTPDEAAVLSAFLSQYYTRASYLPKEILLPIAIPESESLSVWLSSLKGNRVRLKVPKRGEKRRLVKLALENARYSLKKEKIERTHRKEASQALEELVNALSLHYFPHRIEAFDISNTQGGEATGSMVVFSEGRALRSAYRRFKVKRSGMPDDYAMMGEILRRRFRRGLAEMVDPTISRGKFSDFPDLLLIDGGKGQLNVATSILAELEIEGIDVIGLAKRHEEIFQPGEPEPIRLSPGSKALLLLRQIRDEAHRFAITYHRRLRARRSLASRLDAIPGVGPKRKAALINAFGSLDRLARAEVEEIAAVPGIPVVLAAEIAKRIRP
jgi:excinuclease ABC subunit C